jgi:flagellar biosynthesis protein FlhG
MLESRTMNDQATGLRQIAARNFATRPHVYPHVITITSGKGGVGKSTIALNLSLALCAFGKKVLLVDGDTNLGNLDFLLGLAPQFQLAHVLRGERDIEDVLVSAAPHLRLLPGSSGDLEYPHMNPETQRALVADLKQLEERSDYIVIDTSAGLSQEIVGYAVHSDETVVVTTPEPTAVMDAYAMIKVIHLTKPDVSIKVVMNAVRKPAEGDDAAAKLVVAVNRFLKTSFTYLGSIPYDQHVAKSTTHQKAVFEEFPTSSASLTVKAIAQRFLDQSV